MAISSDGTFFHFGGGTPSALTAIMVAARPPCWAPGIACSRLDPVSAEEARHKYVAVEQVHLPVLVL
jgi:hypothetical protein